MGKKIGKQTIEFTSPVAIKSFFSSAAKKEGDGPLGKYFDVVYEDEYIDAKNWEEAENRILKHTVNGAFAKGILTSDDIDYAFSGDLLNQCTASSFALNEMNIPYFGLYGACSTMAESMSLAAVMIDARYGKNTLAATSSHFCSSEKQYRFPLEYGGVRTPTSQWTVTGSGAVILSDKGTSLHIKSITTGKMVDYGISDVNNMGAAMAPAAADCIYTHLSDLNRSPEYYDCIVTGDLGDVGSELLKEIMKKQGIDISGVHKDCGSMIFDAQTQGTNAGGSGCGCSASVFCGYFCKKMLAGEIGRMLLVCTGALMSPTTAQLGKNVVGIAHAVEIENEKQEVQKSEIF